MIPTPSGFRLWGASGAFFAAVFAIWMLFFPQYVPQYFAWVTAPRLAEVFIGGGYIFRSFFFLQFVFEKDWRKLRWTFWGNMVFTGTLLLAHNLGLLYWPYWMRFETLWPLLLVALGLGLVAKSRRAAA